MSLVLAAVILVGHIEDTEQFRSLTDQPRAVRRTVRRAACWPWSLLAIAVRPPARGRSRCSWSRRSRSACRSRRPGTTANLLVPLYLVIAGGLRGAYAWRSAARGGSQPTRGRARSRPLELRARGLPRPLRAPGAVLEGLRHGARAGRLLLDPVRAAVRAAAGGAVDARARARLRRRAGRARARVLRRSGSGSTTGASCSGTRR